jgi:hypothetical protein
LSRDEHLADLTVHGYNEVKECQRLDASKESRFELCSEGMINYSIISL